MPIAALSAWQLSASGLPRRQHQAAGERLLGGACALTCRPILAQKHSHDMVAGKGSAAGGLIAGPKAAISTAPNHARRRLSLTLSLSHPCAPKCTPTPPPLHKPQPHPQTPIARMVSNSKQVTLEYTSLTFIGCPQHTGRCNRKFAHHTPPTWQVSVSAIKGEQHMRNVTANTVRGWGTSHKHPRAGLPLSTANRNTTCHNSRSTGTARHKNLPAGASLNPA